MSDASERTLPATSRRRQLAEREGMLPTAALPAWGAGVAVTVLLLPAWWRATLSAAMASTARAGMTAYPSIYATLLSQAEGDMPLSWRGQLSVPEFTRMSRPAALCPRCGCAPAGSLLWVRRRPGGRRGLGV